MNMKLIMVQHVTDTPKDYFGFKVKEGMFYGIVKTPVGKIPVAWTGWTCGMEIALYSRINGEWRINWINGDDIPAWHICVEREEWDDVPFFAAG